MGVGILGLYQSSAHTMGPPSVCSQGTQRSSRELQQPLFAHRGLSAIQTEEGQCTGTEAA